MLHSGRTDENFGHKDIYNISKLGNYHYHHGKVPHLHPNQNKVSLIKLLKEDGASIFTASHKIDGHTKYSFESIIEIEKFLNSDFNSELKAEMIYVKDSPWIGIKSIDYLVNKDYFEYLLNKLLNSFNIDKSGKFFTLVDNELIESEINEGYGKYIYKTNNDTLKHLNVYQCSLTNEELSVGMSNSLEDISSDKLNPPESITKDVKVKMSLSSFDKGVSNISFHGVALNTDINTQQKFISKDGKINLDIKNDTNILMNHLEDYNWHKYYPNFCIDNNENVEIKWFSSKSDYNKISIIDGLSNKLCKLFLSA